MAAPSNILFIMCDQLRFDYLGCYGHPHLHTPNLDALAARGVRFTRAYVQSPICGPSCMSFYTGRYMRSHGSNWNGFPLRVGEPTLGDHLKEIGIRNVLVGKTHMAADAEGIARLGIDPASAIGVHLAECGFEPYERDDGLHPAARRAPSRYDDYLRAHGFDAANPWEEWANSADRADGGIANGWLLAHADKADPQYQDERTRLREALFEWALRDHNRITTPDRRIEAYAHGQQLRSGILIGYWDEAELAEAQARSAAGDVKAAADPVRLG